MKKQRLFLIFSLAGIFALSSCGARSVTTSSGTEASVAPETSSSTPEGSSSAASSPLINSSSSDSASSSQSSSSSEEKVSFEVSFDNYDGTLLSQELFEKGTMPVYHGTTPIRAGDAEFSYTFDDWDKALAPVVCDVVYTAVFKKVTNSYEITFYDEDGTTVLDQHSEFYGATPVFAKSTPEKASSAQYDYAFQGWDRPLSAVVAATSYHAVYQATLRQYKVSFLDEDGSELQSGKWDYGATPVYSGKTPSKTGDKQYTYTFDDWDKELVPVTGEATYTAKYKSSTNHYTVSFLDDDGKLLESQTLAYGETPVYQGATPSKAKTAQYSYAFDSWSPAISAVTGDASYQATFTATVNTYTIRFVNADGTELDTQTLPYGSTPTYQGATPSKTGDAEFSYTFDGWDKSLAEVTGDATYKATFTLWVNQYTIRFVDEDGTLLQSSDWYYGEMPRFRGKTPFKDPTSTTAYVFSGWDDAIGTVTGAKTYTATYQSHAYKLNYTYDSTNESYTVSGHSSPLYSVLIPATYNDGTNGEHPVTVLFDRAFVGSTTLSRVKILAQISNFCYRAFYADEALTEVSLPEGTTLLKGYEVFDSCPLLTAFTIPSTVTSISNNFFMNSGLTSIAIPEGVTSISYGAFTNCSALADVTFEGTPKITTLGEGAFNGCVALKSIAIPSTVTSFGDDTFKGCTSLQKVTLGSGTTSLNGRWVFNTCRALSSVTIPNTVTSISDYFFSEACFTSLLIPSSVITIGAHCFQNDAKLYGASVADGSLLETIGEEAFADCSNLLAFCFSGTAENFTDLGKNTFKNDTALATLKMAGPNSVKSDNSFAQAGNLSEVTLPFAWSSIPEAFFAGSAITKFTLPRMIKKIGPSAFSGCSSLTSFAFEPYGFLSEVGASAFKDCSALTAISLIKTVTSIGANAFDGCTALTDFRFEGTVDQWNAISKGDDWHLNAGFTTVTCKDGTVTL